MQAIERQSTNLNQLQQIEALTKAFEKLVDYAKQFERRWEEKLGRDTMTADLWLSALRSIHGLLMLDAQIEKGAYEQALVTAGLTPDLRARLTKGA